MTMSAMERWVVIPRPRPMANARVLCIPHAGSGPSHYRSWLRHLPHDVELRLVAPPGREHRYDEPEAERMEDYLNAVLRELVTESAFPLCLFGHSMGAVIAYELALRLEEEGRPPVHTFLSGRGAPTDLPLAEPIGALPDAELLALARLRYGGFPSAFDAHPELMGDALEALRGDLRMLERFRPSFPRTLDSPVTVCWGTGDQSMSSADLRRWGDVGTVRFLPFEGGHFYIQDRTAEVVAHVVRSTQVPPPSASEPA